MSAHLPLGARLRGRLSQSSTLTVSCYVGLVVFSFLQRVGDTTFDTKFDLTASPGRFLERALHLWNPQLNFGELQNQAYGYFFPQGLWFWLLDLAGVPDWISQRAWSALLLVVAFEGTRRLARALGLGTDVAPVLAGLMYALSPRLLGLAGVLSAEVLPTAVLPWIALPVVLGLKGRLSPRSAGLLSGVALLFIGGVNAVENIAALPLVVFLAFSAVRSPMGRRLAGWWCLGSALAAAWWIVPLLVLGRYSPPFLDYIETSVATTSPLGWANVVRGADHWLAFVYVGGEPWWPGANALVTIPILVVMSGAIAALGFVGIFRKDMPHRRPLLLSLVFGLVCLTVARGQDLGSPLAGGVQGLLDGKLALLRNVHKVDPLVRLPLALGFAHALRTLWAFARGGRSDRIRTVVARPAFRVVAVGLTVVMLVISAWPLFSGDLRRQGWKEVPQAWQQAATYLAKDGRGRTLVVPGSGFGLQTWGWTIDEPIQGIATTPWTTRGQVPLVPGSSIRLLDSIEQRLSNGTGSSGLADLLAQEGIGQVLLRRDLDARAVDAPSANRVEEAIVDSAGLSHAASFGRSGFGDQPMVDIYRVDRDVTQVSAVDRSSLVRVSGGSDDLLTAREVGVLGVGRSTIVGGDQRSGVDIVGDGFRRQERQFGRVHDTLSQVMTRADRYRLNRAAHDYGGAPGARRAFLEFNHHVSSVTASSSGGYADALGPIRADEGPASAIDGSLTTAWRSAPLERPDGQWLKVTFSKPTSIGALTIHASVGGLAGKRVKQLVVTAGKQRQVSGVDRVTGASSFDLDGSMVRSLKVRITEVAGHPDTGVVSLAELTIAGLSVRAALVVPSAKAGASTSFVFRSTPARRACIATYIGPQCDASSIRPDDEPLGMRREFTVTQAGSWRMRGIAFAMSTSQAARLMLPLLSAEPRAVASSVYADDPQVSGVFAIDGDPGTPWLAGQGERDPSLRLRLPRVRTISRIRVFPSVVASTRPIEAVITSGDQVRVVDLVDGGFGFFSPMTGNRFRIEFRAPARADLADRPVGVGDLKIDGVGAVPVKNDTASGALCGLGPQVMVDGVTHETMVSGVIGDVRTGQPMAWRVCDGPVDLAAGKHELTVVNTAQFVGNTVALVSNSATPAAESQRDVTLRSWSATHGRVFVGEGPDAVLRVPANVNAGWTATIKGRKLEPVTIDGWQQAFVVPAGVGSTVDVVYAPDGRYRLALLLGLVAALTLLVLAGFARCSSAGGEPIAKPITRTLRRPWLLGLVALPFVYLLLGPAVTVGVVLGGAARLLNLRRLPVLLLAGTVMFLGAALSATSPHLGTGQPGLAADLASALAVGLILGSLLDRGHRTPEPEGPTDA